MRLLRHPEERATRACGPRDDVVSGSAVPMMRLPRFRYFAPSSVKEALRIRAGEGADAAFVAGGTDLYPNMKRRQQTPKTVIGLARIGALARLRAGEAGLSIGAAVPLSAVERHRRIRHGYPALVHAIEEISTPPLRNMGTLGGNVLLDTRCNYYDQNYEWRKAIDFCMKKDGAICWVAPGSPKCLAVQSADSVPDPDRARGPRTARLARGGARDRARGALRQRRHPIPDQAAGRAPDGDPRARARTAGRPPIASSAVGGRSTSRSSRSGPPSAARGSSSPRRGSCSARSRPRRSGRRRPRRSSSDGRSTTARSRKRPRPRPALQAHGQHRFLVSLAQGNDEQVGRRQRFRTSAAGPRRRDRLRIP